MMPRRPPRSAGRSRSAFHRAMTDSAVPRPAPDQNPACADDPLRWVEADARFVDKEAQAICRECPGRNWCADTALRTSATTGMWAGVLRGFSAQPSRRETIGVP